MKECSPLHGGHSFIYGTYTKKKRKENKPLE